MITEFFEEFMSFYSYNYMSQGLITGFEEYITQNNIPLNNVYENIPEYTETLPIANKTRRNYNQKLRNFIRYVYQQKNVVLKHDPRTIIKIKD